MMVRMGIRITAIVLCWVTSASAEIPYFECAGANHPSVCAKQARQAALPSEGVQHVIIIFARFEDDVQAGDRPPAYASNLLDPDLPGSLTHFYLDMSEGRLLLKGKALDNVYTSQHESSWYAHEKYGVFSNEILQEVDADPSVRFSDYDNDGPDGIPNSGDDDGIVDMVFINILSELPTDFFKGTATGASWLGTSYFTQEARPRGHIVVQIGSMQRVWGFAHAVGSMAHEFGHLLGLPDLYDTSETDKEDARPEDDSAGIGYWGLMGRGTMGWGEPKGIIDGPNGFCVWSRMKLGWLGEDNERVVEVTSDLSDVIIGDINTDGNVYKMSISEGEYFLIANRQATGSYYDRNIPQSGLLIWHIDGCRPWNGDEMYKLVDLECADGRYDDKGYPGGIPNPAGGRDNLDFWAHPVHFPGYAEAHQGNLGDATDVFDGVAYTEFSQHTNPNSTSNMGARTNVGVRNIRRHGMDMIVDMLPKDYWSGPAFWSGSIFFSCWDDSIREITWRNEVTVAGDIIIPPGACLSIESGTTVRFALQDTMAGGLDPRKCEIIVEGALVVRGSRWGKVLFTSIASKSRPGDWYGIRVVGRTASVQLDYSEIEYADYGITGAQALADIKLTHTVIRQSSYEAIRLDSCRGEHIFRNGSIYYNNKGGIHIADGGSLVIEDSILETNDSFGILFDGDSLTVDGTLFRGNYGAGILLDGGTLSIRNSAFENNSNWGILFNGAGLHVINSQWRYQEVALFLAGTGRFSPFTVAYCDFVDNECAIQNDTEQELLAEYNWWGTRDATVIAAGITGPVDWHPFLWADKEEYASFRLEPNFPNPFNTSTTFCYHVPGATGTHTRSRPVKLVVFDMVGQAVKTLVDDAVYPGMHYVPWNGRDEAGRAVASGIYVYKMSAPGFTETRKTLIIR